MTHGMTNTRLYRIWENMKQRCENPRDPKYQSYGGKGIHICDEWKNDFLSFYNWAIENGYKDPNSNSRLDLYRNALTIDRIDSEKGYEPSNCRWITFDENRMNRTGISGKGRYNTKNNTIKMMREALGKSIKDISRETKISQWRIREAEAGIEKYFAPSECAKLCASLNSTVEKLFGAATPELEE